jgi:hypothetical protein
MGQVPSPQRIIPGFARGGIADLETVAMQPNEMKIHKWQVQMLM